MALRKAGAYSKRYTRPYTRRSSVKNRNYIKTIPPQKVTKFYMGDINGYEQGKFKFILRLQSKENIQIRDNAIEAARQIINRVLEINFLGQFFFAVKVYPHHILRENKMLTGAGSDRMSTGMQLSFGKTMGRAALVNKDQDIFFIAVSSKKAVEAVRKALYSAKAKFPCSTAVVYEERK